eukprot:CAMPEP_0181172782 /NCGR_PEP_ID=MMETSP1096-20121128/2633_1 /TAXON_ID=156174 ORGANISM="Chrysochromulina ericina, Strain CCMP281" /NCGR_SAMPLE_ID=MMETSP1096 /ASSEMBLY_ACC=CAM_ASM_000453 /LENGTH=55 /DNA_ID=CAMNT_0023260533 /DNA_START=245 /DNA_END=412 /DNA_ORIENTATION=-
MSHTSEKSDGALTAGALTAGHLTWCINPLKPRTRIGERRELVRCWRVASAMLVRC